MLILVLTSLQLLMLLLLMLDGADDLVTASITGLQNCCSQ